MSLDRRTVLKGSLAAAVVTGGPFAGFVNAPAGAVQKRGLRPNQLVPIKDKRDGVVRLALPRGFSYRSFHDTETPVVLDDGTTLPGRHDGMGSFDGPRNSVFLVRNHEVNGSPGAFGPETAARYDAAAGGGTTTIQVTRQGKVLDSWTSLSGTMVNCSGGIMPWGSWITCEETINGPDVGPDFTGATNTSLEKPHGYIFDVPAQRGRQATAEPITAAGRFAHEAVSYDPVGKALYLTEDNFAFASGFYRYTPKTDPMKRGGLDNDGRLEMLAIDGQPNAHLEGHHERGTTFPVTWVPIEDPDPDFPMPAAGEKAVTTNNTAITYVGRQGWALGAAYFSRLEGQVYEDGVVFFTATQGGGEPEKGFGPTGGYGNGHGQVWAYDTTAETLTMVYESPGPDVLDFPDNITTRNGTLILCEDGPDDNYVRALLPDGALVDVVWNQLYVGGRDRTDDEFAGSTFSPDGKTLFVNIQASKGISFAIWGPWAALI